MSNEDKNRESFVCNFCKKHFKHRSSLSRHMGEICGRNTHTLRCKFIHTLKSFKEEKKIFQSQFLFFVVNCFVCIKCGVQFTRKSHLKTHEDGIHKKARVACEICQLKMHANSLGRHMKKKHGIETKTIKCKCLDLGQFVFFFKFE